MVVVRLYLSSYQLGDHPELLSGLVRGDRRGWVIMNALDGLDDDRRRRDTERQIANLETLNLTAENFDLREHDAGSIAADFGDPAFVWVRGGNVFTLRAAMARSGADHVIVHGLQQDAFVYAGFSAGACVLAPNLAGLERCDSAEACLTTYGHVKFDGLGILDRPVVPHLSSPDHPETEVLGEVAALYNIEHQPFWALRDGQALVVDGSETTIH